ncbi:hypothetical protein PFISCL1PPCAC_18262 [Pristionchus fissidentatus]|uniref:BTB domain-containing protein n=1 Tax=Pristionchus fissidentatus TaxID=1538716 RepID=A0AAV5W8K4_9BILA|nr:hypothetical protein PFISCL1PPCAC_18262 [Pristionchus fissidentatus]
MTKVFERDNASAASTTYRTPITNRRRRTSTSSTGSSSSSSTSSPLTMLAAEPKTPSAKASSPVAKMARMPLSILRKFSGLGSSHSSTSSQASAAGAAAADTPPCCKGEERKKSSHRSLLDAFTWRSTKSLQSSKSDSSLDSMGEEKPVSMRRPVPSSSSFPRFSDHTACKVRSIEVTKRALVAGGGWRKHRRLNMAIRFSEHNTKVELRIDAKWTVEEIRTLVGILYEFRLAVEEAVIDAPICELLVAAIAEISLDKWYAFQCFMKALSVEDIHLTGVSTTKPNEIYWPNLKRLIVNTTPEQAPHLSRLLDYGVADDRLVDRQQIELVHINVMDTIDTAQMTKITKDINNFRCWAGSAGFDERFHIGQYTVV